MNALFDLGFKSMFLHLESVMATFAMALPTACVVDIGSSKTSVCCIEEGIIITKSIIRKHFGGDDLTNLLSRLLQSNSALHFFPQNCLSSQYAYHKYLVEQIKEKHCTMEMSLSEIVKTCTMFIKDMDKSKVNGDKQVTQVTFNASDALLYCCQALFYTQLINCVKKSNRKIEGREQIDPIIAH